MTSPESPAVQDTDRLREVAAEAEGLRRNGPASDGRGWYRTEADRMECFAIAAAVLAAVLPVHRAQVLEEAATAIDHVSPPYGKYETSARGWLNRAASTVRRLAVSAPPTPPGSPPADERGTAVETGRAEPERGCPQVVWDGPYSYRCNLGGAGWVCAKHGRFGPPAPPAAVPGTGDDPPACGRCRRPFDPDDRDAAGAARYGESRFCRGCVDRCHESADAFHECPVCAS